MAKRFTKSEVIAFNLEVLRELKTMWILFLLQSIYLAVTFAQTTSPVVCPQTCECSGDFVKCIQRGFEDIPVNLSKIVKTLDLSGNNISLIKNDGFLNYPYLFELNLNNNDISEISKLGKLPKSLRYLHLKENKLKSLAGIPWSELAKLDVSGNQIKKLDNVTFQGCKKLNTLNLSNNQIKEIPDNALTNIPSLQELELNDNQLTKIPHMNLKNMNSLDLSNNQMENVSYHDFQSLPSLQILKLSNNKIKSIKTAAFWKLKLKRIYLNNNLLTNIKGEWLFGLKDLLHLYLQNNKIINISSQSWDANTCCSRLKYINLANNKLHRVLTDKASGNGARFGQLRSLLTLDLSSNGLFEISDNSFRSLQKLKVLDISVNKLSWTSYDSNGTFRGLRSLRKLDLSNNEITSVVKVMFDEIPTISKLDITDNPIEEVSSKSFSPLKNLKDLRMNTHSLYCGCKLQWFFQWLKTKLEAKHFSRLAMLKCRQPRRLYQRDFSSIDSKDLVCDFSRPEIMKHPKSKIALKGNDVRLSCAVRNGSIEGIKIVWKKDLKTVSRSHSEVKEITQVTDGNSLYYQSVLHLFNVNEPRDAGLYQCIVVTREGELKSRKARLDVFVAPKFTSKPRDLETTVGGDARFNCSASGYPPPKIYFTKKADIHKLVNQGRIGLDGQTFIIRNTTRSDVGLYWCFAQSKAGLINTTFHINMRGKPVPVHPMFNKVALRHDSVMFACVTTGWPKPKYVWLKNGKDVDLTSRNIKLRQEQNAEYLIIISAEDSDAGEYKCLVSNELGSTELTSRLNIVEDLTSKNMTSSSGLTNDKLIAIIVFTASCTMVITALVCIAFVHVLHRRGSFLCLTRQKYPDNIATDMYNRDGDQQDFMEMEPNLPGESPRSSTTFVTSNSHSTSESNFLQTSGSDSGSTKENLEGSFDGRQSSGVCSMNSSASSLVSATTTSHRNTFPFSNNSKAFYPAISFYDTSDDSASCQTGNHCGSVRPGTEARQVHRQTLLTRCIDDSPSRRKPTSRSRDRRVDKRHKSKESERLCDRPCDEVARTSPETMTTEI